ncbi:hypothetical protein JTE90_005173 [Oedothorax gibbosus]|uniref:Uncharacterized protein n=2 Tax=Oedothorax gibbosus TaxID=931172 RepID=A0AAV6TQS8_9ARAC|nr:hypothetical protein JTE90_005173 [Oedothorax gibbosus]
MWRLGVSVPETDSAASPLTGAVAQSGPAEVGRIRDPRSLAGGAHRRPAPVDFLREVLSLAFGLLWQSCAESSSPLPRVASPVICKPYRKHPAVPLGQLVIGVFA